MPLNELDGRTQKYLSAIKSNLGYIGSNFGWNSFEDICKKTGVNDYKLVTAYHAPYFGMNISDISVYEYCNNGEKRYCAEIEYQTEIDDFCIETHMFTKFPTLDSFKTIRDVIYIEEQFKYGKAKPVFKCWECGRTVHWLDIDGSFSDKIDNLKEEYCGC